MQSIPNRSFAAFLLFSLLTGCQLGSLTPSTNFASKAVVPSATSPAPSSSPIAPCSTVTGNINVAVGTCGAASGTCPANMSVAWEDDFPSTYDGAPDPSKWTYQIGNGQGGWGNGELEYYTSSTSNAYISPGGGTLNIAALNQPTDGFQYTSARLNSLKSWLYGHFEAEAQVPNGLGTWPGIWMMPESSVYGVWPNSGELDILETVGFSVNTAHATVHGLALAGQPNPGAGVSTTLPAPTDNTAFHVYAMDWTAQQISFTMDGAPYPGTYVKPQNATWQQWPFDQPFYFILNEAVGGSWGGQDGVNAAAFQAPGQILQIKYVRVCQ